MTYNSTVDINSLNLDGILKYDQNEVYEYSLRNIKYLSYDPLSRIDNKLVDNFNAMIVRKDANYYEMSRSKLNYPMNHRDVLQSYRNELSDYLKLYNDWIIALDNLNQDQIDDLINDYKYYIINFTIPEIIRLNNIIALQISIPNDVKIEHKFIAYQQNIYIVAIGIIIFVFIMFIIIKTNPYYY
jgi:hypothetical protein